MISLEEKFNLSLEETLQEGEKRCNEESESFTVQNLGNILIKKLTDKFTVKDYPDEVFIVGGGLLGGMPRITARKYLPEPLKNVFGQEIEYQQYALSELPRGVRTNRCGRKHNQRMSQWEYGKDISYLSHKAKAAGIECFTGTERGTFSRCPECGHHQKPKGRTWQCRNCGFIGHRDVVGATNMHLIAYGEKIEFPYKITYLRPGKTRNVVVAPTRAKVV